MWYNGEELHHRSQEILLQLCGNNLGFVEFMIDIGLLYMAIVRRDIQIEHLDLKNVHFFCQDNEILE